jgi:hypothetical protein
VLSVAGIFGVINSINFFRQAPPQQLDVKFIDYNMSDSSSTIKQGQHITIAFKIVNNEPNDVSNVSVKTNYNGTLRAFSIDKPNIVISSPIGSKGGRSGIQTISITGLQNDARTSESNFTMSLYVGSNVTDTKNFKLRLEK